MFCKFSGFKADCCLWKRTLIVCIKHFFLVSGRSGMFLVNCSWSIFWSHELACFRIVLQCSRKYGFSFMFKDIHLTPFQLSYILIVEWSVCNFSLAISVDLYSHLYLAMWEAWSLSFANSPLILTFLVIIGLSWFKA